MLWVALAALTAAGAQASAAKTQGRSPSAAGAHATHRRTVSHRAHRAPRARAHASATHKPTPDEAGREAGLAIRRQLEQEQIARRRAAVSQELSQTARHADSIQFTYPPAAKLNAEPEEVSLRIPRGGMPPPLRGSLASLERQNERLDAEGLERIEDEADLAARIAHGLLAPLPVSDALTVNADLPPNHRYCRPWTARFLADLARAHEAVFQRPLKVSSAVRTVEYQKQLMETNGNAAPAEGDIVSPHLTGAAVDIAKDSLTRDELAWMRRRLAALEAAGKIDVEEEFEQACFHITVYKSYAPAQTPRRAARAEAGTARSRRSKAGASIPATAQGL